MTQHIGWLYADYGSGPVEIFNHARTLAHLDAADISCARVSIHGTECAVMSKDPSSGAALTLATPSTGSTAPWWDGVSGSPSSKAYGFWIDDWTGLDSSHLRRSAAPISPRGARFSRLGQGARVMKFNITLFGADPVALEHLFRWLEDKVINCTSTCFGATLWARTMCPGSYGDDYGLVLLPGAYMLEGLSWLDDPIPELSGFIRRATLTLGVADPCLYTRPATIKTLTAFSSPNHCSIGIDDIFGCPTGVDQFSSMQISAAITGANIGTRAPLATFKNAHATEWSIPVTLIGVEGGSAAVSGNTLVGQVWLRGVPPNSEVSVDCAQRRVMKRTIGASTWSAADDLLDAAKGVPAYPSFRSNGYVIFRPTFAGNFMSDLSVSATAVQRYGCC